jgi:hypothetical protein
MNFNSNHITQVLCLKSKFRLTIKINKIDITIKTTFLDKFCRILNNRSKNNCLNYLIFKSIYQTSKSFFLEKELVTLIIH